VTRTYFIGKISDDMRIAYQAVYESLQAGINSVKEGITYSNIYDSSYNILKKYGFRRTLGTATGTGGHGIGLEVHERPWLRPGSIETVKEGHIFTIEPGVYIPGKFGVRIEDDILVYRGVHNLTLIEKNIEECII